MASGHVNRANRLRPSSTSNTTQTSSNPSLDSHTSSSHSDLEAVAAGYQRQPGGTISNGSTFLMSANMAKRQPRSRSTCTRAAANRGHDVERAALALARQTSRNISARFRPCSDPFP